MINDPLLQNPATQTQTSEKDSVTRPIQKRRKHPAVSARILALGLSTTALIGMSAGYAAAEKKADVLTPLTESTGTQPAAPVIPAAPTAPITPTTDSLAASTPQVVEIPMPSVAAPAEPGNPVVQANPAYTQNSNGSN